MSLPVSLWRGLTGFDVDPFHHARMATNREGNRSAAHRAVFRRGVGTRFGVGLEGKSFSAVRADHFDILKQVHRYCVSDLNLRRISGMANGILRGGIFSGGLGGDGDPFRVAPEVFQAVVGSFFGVKDVYDDIAVIEDDPMAGGEAVFRMRFASELGPHFVANGFCDGFELRLRFRRADHEKFRKGRDVAEVEYDRIDGLPIQGGGGTCAGQRFAVSH